MASKTPAGKTGSVQAANSLPAVETELPYAIIEHAANNSVLYPIDASDGTTATLTLPANATDVMFYMAVKGQDEPRFEPVSVENGVNVVGIPPQWISYCIGHTVLIKYTANAGGRALESLTLELEIQQIREEDLFVSRPVFTHAKEEWNTWYLRMQEFSGDEIVAINAWPMIQPGQRLFVVVAGNQHVAPYRFTWVAKNHVVQEHEARPEHVFRFKLSRGWLSRLDDYSAITAHLGVIWDTTEPVYPEPGDPILENPLPVNAEDFHLRTTSLLRVDPALDLKPPHLRESTQYNDEWCLNPENTQEGGEIIIQGLDTYKGDEVRFYVSGPAYAKKLLGDFTVEQNGEMPFVKLPACVVACFFNKQMTLSYDLAAGGPAQSSQARVISVLTPEFQRPLIEEANQDRMLCLDNFPGDAKVIAPLGGYGECASHCWMWIDAEYADGSAYRFDILDGEIVTQAWKSDGVRADIPRAALEKIGDCSTFELRVKTGFCEASELKNAHEFPPARFTIYQEPLAPRAPTVREAQGGILVPWNAREGVHVEAVYEGCQPSHQHTAQWCLDGADSCWPLPLQKGASGPVTFLASREQMINSFRKTALISYTVINACKQMVSETLALQVGEPLMQRRPRPVVKQATGDVLDLRTFPGKDAQVIVKSTDVDVDLAWWFFVEGHVGVMTLEGTAQDGSPITVPIMARPLESGDRDGLSCLIPHSELEKLKDDTYITINFSHFIGPLGSVEIKFQALRLLFINPVSLPVPSVPEAENGELNFLRLCCEKDAHLVAAPWDKIATDNRISLICTGTAIGGGPHSVVLLPERDVAPLEVLEGLNIAITNAQFFAFANDSVITLRLSVRFANDTLRPFEPVALELIKSRQIVERFDGQPDKLLKPGESLRLSTMTITMVQLATNARGGIHTFANVGEFMSGPAFGFCIDTAGFITPTQITRFAFDVPCACLRFAYVHLDGQATVRFYGESGVPIETRIVDSAKGGRHQWVEFKAGKGELLASFEVEVGEHGYLDNFTMCSPVNA
ncbi:hypothetical protein [Pseudomonas fluorescens]